MAIVKFFPSEDGGHIVTVDGYEMPHVVRFEFTADLDGAFRAVITVDAAAESSIESDARVQPRPLLAAPLLAPRKS